MKPRIYSKEEHNIDVNQIDPEVLYILEKLRKADYVAYLVGGGVRDLLLNQKPKDFDVSTSAKPEEIRALFSSAVLIGKRFRLAHIRFGRKVIEVSTFRAGDIENEQLITEDNIWGDAKQDVLRRDFTINGLFYDSEKEQLIDYVGGYLDIQKKYLRVIGNPCLRFKQDPVRMIRCLKFQARYHFELDKEMKEALARCKTEIVKSAWARILEELLRMLESKSAASFFKLMTHHQLLKQLTPDLSSFLETEEGHVTYNYLQVAGEMAQTEHQTPLKRPVLLCCLIFSLLEKHLRVCSFRRKKPLHLGEIYQETIELIDTIFGFHFRLPRRLKIMTLDILVSQYRITPLSGTKKRRAKIPYVSYFDLALQFLSVRAKVDPSLKGIALEWTQLFKKIPQIWDRNRRKPRKRRIFRKRV